MKLEDFNFLLDENVDHRVKDIFVKYSVNFTTVQEQGWTGVSDKKLCTLIRETGRVLITRDKDFIFMWKPHQISVIYISIKPLNLHNVRMRLIDLFENTVLDIDEPFLLILQQENIRILK